MSKISLNYDYQIKIDITPTATTPTYVVVADGFSNLTEAQNEAILQQSYLDDAGYGSTEVTGGQHIITLTGNRMIGDAAQDYMFSDAVYHNWGEARKTSVIIMYPDGTIVHCPVTLANISRGGGDANTGTSASVEIHFNGKPTTVNLSLAVLQVGALTLSPTFNANTFNYTVTTTNETEVVQVAVDDVYNSKALITYRTATSAPAAVAPTLTCTWLGTADVIITVTHNTLNISRDYTITVHHS